MRHVACGMLRAWGSDSNPSDVVRGNRLGEQMRTEAERAQQLKDQRIAAAKKRMAKKK